MDTSFALQYLYDCVGRNHVINEQTYHAYRDIICSYGHDGAREILNMDSPDLSLGHFSLFKWDRVNGFFTLKNEDNDPFQMLICLDELLSFVRDNEKTPASHSILGLFDPDFLDEKIILEDKKVIDGFWGQRQKIHFRLSGNFSWRGTKYQLICGDSAYDQRISVYHTHNGPTASTSSYYSIKFNRFGTDEHWMGVERIYVREFRAEFNDISRRLGLYENVYGIHWTMKSVINLIEGLFRLTGKLPEYLPRQITDIPKQSVFKDDLEISLTDVETAWVQCCECLNMPRHERERDTAANKKKRWDLICDIPVVDIINAHCGQV